MTTTIRFRALALCLALATPAAAAPLRVLAIGDSMTEEYAFELPFSAPESNPTNANTRSWPELLRIFRPTEATLGPYESTAFAYGDLRNAGHEWNFGIPGMTTRNWFILINTDDPFDPPSGEPLGFSYYDTRRKLIDELLVAEAVVILLGANDLKQEYNDLFNNTEATTFLDGVRNRIAAIHDWVRLRRPNVPIVVCTLPDVGATPQISGTYNDPVKQASTRIKIAALNQSIITWAAGKAKPPAIARIDHLTNRIFDQQPFHLNGTVFTLAGDPENPPTRVFCRDGFHAATMAQALIANEIMSALEDATGSELTLFSNREILRNLLGLNPDQPYLDWITAAGLGGSGMDEDPDRDGFPNLAEYLLDSPPGNFGRPLIGSFAPGSWLSWQPSPIGLRFGSLIAEESTDLNLWSRVPAGRTNVAPDGKTSITPAAGSRGFARLRAEVRP
jgi:lysophospholipase L1-like esterase